MLALSFCFSSTSYYSLLAARDEEEKQHKRI